jgi:thiol-disulfide isomerase/thioredoxin
MSPRGRVHALASAVAFFLAACERAPTPPDGASPRSATAAASSSSSAPAVAASAPPPERSLLPTWPPLPSGQPAPPKVRPYDGAKKPTLVVFFGTWCGGCVAGVLSDAALASRFASQVRVGLALMADNDETFLEFAKTVKVPLTIEVWSDDPATRALKEKCDIHGLPMSCLLDADGKLLWRGEPGSAGKMLDAFVSGRLDEAKAGAERAAAIVDAAAGAADDAKLRARAVAAAAGLGGLENNVAWRLVEKGENLELAAALARDATVATSGLDFASLDTYAFALWKLGQREPALAAATRGIAVCDALGLPCPEERARHAQLKGR